METEKRIIELSWTTILRVLFVVLLAMFLYFIRDIAAIVLFALVIASAIDPLAVWLQRKGISRLFTVPAVYVIFLSFIGFVVYLIIPPIFNEAKELSLILPGYMEKVSSYLQFLNISDGQKFTGNLDIFLNSAQDNFGSVAENTVTTAVNIFGGVTSAVLILIISFYLSVREHGIDNFLRAIVPLSHEHYAMNLWARSKRKIGQWAQGQLVLGFIVGITVFIGLSLLGINYAVILGIIAGIAELVPIVGVMVSGTVAVLLAAAQQPLLGVMTFLLFVIVQQFENHIIVPLVMNRIIGLSPLVIILSLLIGLKLGGILGMLLAIPLAAVAVEFWSDFEKKKIEA